MTQETLDASRRYKAFVSKPDVTVNSSGFCPAVSADGLEWKVLYNSCVPSSDEANAYRDNESGLFVFAVKHAGPYGRSVYLALSRDFEHWTDPRDCLSSMPTSAIRNSGERRLNSAFRSRVSNARNSIFPPSTVSRFITWLYFAMRTFTSACPRCFIKPAISKDWPGFDKYELPPEIVRDVHLYGDWTGFHHLQLVASRNLVD